MKISIENHNNETLTFVIGRKSHISFYKVDLIHALTSVLKQKITKSKNTIKNKKYFCNRMRDWFYDCFTDEYSGETAEYSSDDLYKACCDIFNHLLPEIKKI